MSFREDIEMVIGGLAHGLDFDTAFGLVEQAKADRRARKPQVGAYKADIATQMLNSDVDPARLSAYAQMVAPSYKVKPGRAENIAGNVGGMLGGTWTDDDDAAALDPDNPLSTYSLLAEQIKSAVGPEGAPDRAELRRRIAAQQGVTQEEMAGWNQAFDRAFDIVVAKTMPDKYEAYREKLTTPLGGDSDPAGGLNVPGWAKAVGTGVAGATGYGGLRALTKAATGRTLPAAGIGGHRFIRGAGRMAGSAAKTGLSNLIQGTRLDPATQPYGQVGKFGEALSRITRPTGTTPGEVSALNLLKSTRANMSTSGGVTVPSFLYDPDFMDDPQAAMERYRAEQERPGTVAGDVWELLKWGVQG